MTLDDIQVIYGLILPVTFTVFYPIIVVEIVVQWMTIFKYIVIQSEAKYLDSICQIYIEHIHHQQSLAEDSDEKD